MTSYPLFKIAEVSWDSLSQFLLVSPLARKGSGEPCVAFPVSILEMEREEWEWDWPTSRSPLFLQLVLNKYFVICRQYQKGGKCTCFDYLFIHSFIVWFEPGSLLVTLHMYTLVFSHDSSGSLDIILIWG